MIMPKQYLDVLKDYPAFRDLSAHASKSHYNNTFSTEDNIPHVKTNFKKEAAGKDKTTTAKNAKDLKD